MMRMLKTFKSPVLEDDKKSAAAKKKLASKHTEKLALMSTEGNADDVQVATSIDAPLLGTQISVKDAWPVLAKD